MVSINIDGIDYSVEKNSLLIDTMIDNGLDISYFCYHKSLGCEGSCRMCMVEIEGAKRPQIACDTLIKDGMRVSTKSDKIKATRKEILELELINHPIDCPTCDKAGECKLQDSYMDNGLYDNYIDKTQKAPKKPNIDFGGGVLYNPNRCVLCTRCVRFTRDITKSSELGVLKRANKSYISTIDGLDNNSYAKNIVSLCPVGALSDKDFRFKQRVWFLKSTPSFCIGCAKVCSIYIDHNREKNKTDKIYRFRPRENREINEYFICDYGRDSFNNFQSNLTTNVIEPQTIISTIKEKIKTSKNIVVMVDANLYNEDIEKIYKFSNTISAKLISPLEPYYDKTFGDKWLKNSYKCANIFTIKEYNIAQKVDIDDIDLLINFNHPTPLEAKYRVSFQTHNDNRVSNLKVPIKVYTQYSGSITNIDGITQTTQKVVDSDIYSVSEWVERILEEIFAK